MSFSRLKPKYASVYVVHNDYTKLNETIDATIQQSYTKPLIQDSSDYVCAVERMEINGNAIPFYDAVNPANNFQPESITLIDKANSANTTSTIIGSSAYSLSDLLNLLNAYRYYLPSDGTTVVNLNFTLDEDGFIHMIIKNASYSFTNFYVVIPKYLNKILGLSTVFQLTGLKDCRSQYPRLDCGDQLNHIVLATNLNTISDSIGVAQANVLTDFAPETRYSNNLQYNDDGTLNRSSFSTNLRQKIVYSPTERRYLDLISPFNISFLRIEAFYVDDEGTSARVQLPYGCSFQVKLGFYKKE